ncbi:hypothetical protein ACGFMM_00150 [Streptomyces sp. NPDC048604]|uniref:hypothetical protein n=1 Tax=Streptomyces sp. NPDC048604 TaxID=3365578 RepID=UPI00371089BD
MNRVWEGLAENPSLPAELVDRLIGAAVRESDEWLARWLGDRDDLDREQVRTLAEFDDLTAAGLARRGLLTAADVDPVTRPRTALALLEEGRAGESTAPWARLLVRDPDVMRREKLTECPGLPQDVVETLLADPEIRVVAEVAIWTTSPERAAALARHPHAKVRRGAATNPVTPPEALAALLTGEGLTPADRCEVCDREPPPFVHAADCPRTDCDLPPDARCDGTHEYTVHYTRLAALENPATPADAAAGYADAESMLHRAAVAARTDLPPWAAVRLAADETPYVREELAANAAIGEETMRLLARDPYDDVRRGLARNPRIPLDLLSEVAARTKPAAGVLPRVAAATRDELELLAASPLPSTRLLAARRRDLPAELRDALAADADAKVAGAVAPHTGLTEGQLREILRRFGPQAAAAVASNPDASPALLTDLAALPAPPRKALQAIAAHPHATPAALRACLGHPRTRSLAAAHPALPPDVLVSLLVDPDESVAEAAATNPSLPVGAMANLVP